MSARLASERKVLLLVALLAALGPLGQLVALTHALPADTSGVLEHHGALE
jgi:hypothetical protein